MLGKATGLLKHFASGRDSHTATRTKSVAMESFRATKEVSAHSISKQRRFSPSLILEDPKKFILGENWPQVFTQPGVWR